LSSSSSSSIYAGGGASVCLRNLFERIFKTVAIATDKKRLIINLKSGINVFNTAINPFDKSIGIDLAIPIDIFQINTTSTDSHNLLNKVPANNVIIPILVISKTDKGPIIKASKKVMAI
jgi:hypothetical protein